MRILRGCSMTTFHTIVLQYYFGIFFMYLQVFISPACTKLLIHVLFVWNRCTLRYGFKFIRVYFVLCTCLSVCRCCSCCCRFHWLCWMRSSIEGAAGGGITSGAIIGMGGGGISTTSLAPGLYISAKTAAEKQQGIWKFEVCRFGKTLILGLKLGGMMLYDCWRDAEEDVFHKSYTRQMFLCLFTQNYQSHF